MGDLSAWDQARKDYYQYVHRENGSKREPVWRGARLVKYPTDMILYAMAIQENRPDIIIETGSAFGASAMFFADMLSLFVPGGRVLSIDVASRHSNTHPGVEFVIGSSVEPSIVERVRSEAAGKRVMVVLDSDHRRRHVIRELCAYGPIVTPGQFLVVEDCYTYRDEPFYPYHAVEWYLKRTKKFQLEPVEDRYIFAVTRGGWLRMI